MWKVSHAVFVTSNFGGTMKPLFIAQLALAVAGCGSTGLATDGGGGDQAVATGDLAIAPPDMSVTGDQACTDYATALCTKIGACSPVLQLVYGDVATCTSRVALTCSLTLGLPGSPSLPGPLEACSASLANVTCDDLLSGNTPAGCMVMGSETDGLACADDAQCASGRCVKPVAGGCGTCGTPPGAGASCATSACAPGLECGKSSKICVARAKLGDSCNADRPCLPSLACMGVNGSGTCVTPIAAGGKCDPAQKDFAGCDSSHAYYCSGFTNTCQLYNFAQAGEACGLVNGATLCAKSGVCTPNDAGAFMGTCVAAAADGTACDANVGPNCLPPAFCYQGFCRLPSPGSCK
jgi:hypothetical protein